MKIDDYGTPNTSMPWSVFPVIVYWQPAISLMVSCHSLSCLF
jgi:hypothetical protein